MASGLAYRSTCARAVPARPGIFRIEMHRWNIAKNQRPWGGWSTRRSLVRAVPAPAVAISQRFASRRSLHPIYALRATPYLHPKHLAGKHRLTRAAEAGRLPRGFRHLRVSGNLPNDTLRGIFVGRALDCAAHLKRIVIRHRSAVSMTGVETSKALRKSPNACSSGVRASMTPPRHTLRDRQLPS